MAWKPGFFSWSHCTETRRDKAVIKWIYVQYFFSGCFRVQHTGWLLLRLLMVGYILEKKKKKKKHINFEMASSLTFWYFYVIHLEYGRHHSLIQVIQQNAIQQSCYSALVYEYLLIKTDCFSHPLIFLHTLLLLVSW